MKQIIITEQLYNKHRKSILGLERKTRDVLVRCLEEIGYKGKMPILVYRPDKDEYEVI